MSQIADTPNPPYYAVIFTSLRTADDDGQGFGSNNDDGYNEMAQRMLALASQQPGFLGVESARQALGITVSYWSDLDAIQQWKANVEHQVAQRLGRDQWYSSFKVRITKVERDYGIG